MSKIETKVVAAINQRFESLNITINEYMTHADTASPSMKIFRELMRHTQLLCSDIMKAVGEGIKDTDAFKAELKQLMETETNGINLSDSFEELKIQNSDIIKFSLLATGAIVIGAVIGKLIGAIVALFIYLTVRLYIRVRTGNGGVAMAQAKATLAIKEAAEHTKISVTELVRRFC